MARFTYGYFGNPLPPGYTPVGPQTVVGQAGPAGGTVVSITPGPVLERRLAPMPGSSVSMTSAPVFVPGPTAAPAPAPVNQAVPTGQVTAVDMPGAGKVDLPVYVAPIPKAEIVPGPGGGLVVVVPKDQISNLPTKPARVMPKGVPGDTAPISYSAEMWNTYFNFPPTGRLPVNTQPAVDVTAAARGSAQEAPVDVRDLTVTSTGIFDREGRPYPTTQPLRTVPTGSPGAGGLMRTAPGVVAVLDATPRTDGTVVGTAEDVEARMRQAREARQNAVVREAAANAGMSFLPLLGAAGAGFLVAGPVGAGVGAVIGFLITPKQGVSK